MECSNSGLLTPDDIPEHEEVDTYEFDRQREIDWEARYGLRRILTDLTRSQDKLRKAIRRQAG